MQKIPHADLFKAMMIEEDHKALADFLVRALRGDDVCFDEIAGVTISVDDVKQRELVDEFWNELMMFVHDRDLRVRDPEYARDKSDRLRDSLAKLKEAGVLA